MAGRCFHFGRVGPSLARRGDELRVLNLASGWVVLPSVEDAVPCAPGVAWPGFRSVWGEGLGRSGAGHPVEKQWVGGRGAGGRSWFWAAGGLRHAAHDTTGGVVDGSALVAESSSSGG